MHENTVQSETGKTYYVVYVDYGNKSVIYLLDKISENIEAERFCFRIF